VNELALFAGAGGGLLGSALLVARQNDGLLPAFPIWDDIRTFDGCPWRGHIDVVSGGFPCQDISCANPSGRGLDGERSGLWSEMRRIIREVRPRYVFIENVPQLIKKGLERVLCDLAALGYDASWGVIGAHHTGAFHKRDRLWIVAHANGDIMEGLEQEPQQGEYERPPGLHGRAGGISNWRSWPSEPDVGRVAHGVSARLDRLKSLGNAIVPECAKIIFSYPVFDYWRLHADNNQ